jgi:hypothetical protein
MRIARVVLNYAENERRKRRAGILRLEYKPEEPHNTTAVLSAQKEYHISTVSAPRKRKYWENRLSW